MKIVQKSKIFVASLAAAAVLAGCPAALAVSPAGYNVPSEIEQTNAAEDEQMQAIKAAAAKVKVSYDAVQRCWMIQSPFLDTADSKTVCSTAPWIFVFDGRSSIYSHLTFSYYGKERIITDTVFVRAGDTLYTFECDPNDTDFGYDSNVQYWWAVSGFDMPDEQVDWLRDMLSQDTVIVRFSGVDGTQHDYTWTAEDRQAVTDMINLYDLLKAASPEVRARALNG